MNRLKGIIAVMISAVVFGSMPLMAKIVYQEGGNAVTLTFLRFIIVLPVLYFFVSQNKKISTKVTKEEFKKLLIIGTFGYGGTALTLYMSYNYIASGIATTLHFVYPVLVILAYVILFKYPASSTKLLAVSLTLIGVLLLNDSGGEVSLLGIGLAFGSAITYSFYVVFLDRSGLKNMHPLKMTMYLCLVASTMMFIYGLSTKTLVISMSPLGWGVSTILALMVAFFGVSLFQIGVSLIGPESTSILSTLEPITSIVIGVVIFNEVITTRMIFGFAAILAAVIIITVFDRS